MKNIESVKKAIEDGNLEVLKLLLVENSSFMDVRFNGCNGQGSLLHYAAYYNQSEVIKFLVEEKGMGVNLTQGVENSWSPLHEAVYGKAQSSIGALMELGADIYLQGSDNKTALDVNEEGANIIKSVMQEPFYQERLKQKELELKRNKREGTWSSVIPEEVEHTYEHVDAGYKITNIFNFKSRQVKSITKDIASGSLTQTIQGFDAISDRSQLEDAADRLNKDFGGKVNKKLIYARPIVGKRNQL